MHVAEAVFDSWFVVADGVRGCGDDVVAGATQPGDGRWSRSSAGERRTGFGREHVYGGSCRRAGKNAARFRTWSTCRCSVVASGKVWGDADGDYRGGKGHYGDCEHPLSLIVPWPRLIIVIKTITTDARQQIKARRDRVRREA